MGCAADSLLSPRSNSRYPSHEEPTSPGPMKDRPWYEDVPVPQLMRAARDVYRIAVRRALDDAQCEDIPRNGIFVLTGLDHRSRKPMFSPQADVVASLGLSKQAASQLIDTLVVREYLERRPDPEDRRRMEVRLTDRGRIAALAIQRATDAVDATIADLISTEQLDGFRAGLAAYREIGER
jgi:DNA-binding MarR family transcriptional regulator